MPNNTITYKINFSTAADIAKHLQSCDINFIPPLSNKVNIDQYALKLRDHAVRIEAWVQDELIGLIAMYCNNKNNNIAFISNVSVIKLFAGKGVSTSLMSNSVNYAEQNNFNSIQLEVNKNNIRAINLYKKYNFTFVKDQDDSQLMQLSFPKNN